MKKTKLAFLHSVLALLLCVSMLVGTTFAWFTDGVTSGKNRIVAGNLDVELYYMNDETSTWQPVGRNTNVFKQGTLWEPGHTEVVKLKVVNAGSLALKYQLGIYVASEVQGTNMAGETFKLSDYIKYGVVEGDQNYDRKAAVAAVNGSAKKLNEAYAKPGTLNSGEAVFTVVVYMPESVDNVANYRGDAIPKIELGIQLAATQLANELDSFGPDYDAGATYPPVKIDFSTTQPVPAEKVDDTGALVEAVTVGNQDGIRAEVPAGALLVPGANDLGLVLESKEDSEANLNLKDGQSANPLDIKMPNLDPKNTQLIKVTIPGLMRKGLNSTSVEMYHVENGVTVAMKLEASLADLDAHNEFYYDPATGDVTICTKSFSEYVAVTDNLNLWKGAYNTEWYNTPKQETIDGVLTDVYTINSADELAGLGLIVDGGYYDSDKVWYDAPYVDDFANKTVKLGADINLAGGYSLNPIGCGYVNGVGNSGSVTGRAFMGTFDGQNYTISNLYQNGWELGLEYCNLGGGLFASIANGTVKNLTISGANIVMECVEQGILVGLSQGTCTYENITINNSKVANYQKATGGLIGETSAMNGGGKTIIKDVVIGSDVVVGSLWGDFDAPVGGVIGARWDDADVTEIEMTNVTVAARLDVYNDVTSSYQWYAYRRAGMLIGNTEQVAEDGRTAKADFLTCSNVVVKYGDWVNYHYCEFNNHNSSWPFVRVEAGENCTAFSNPRWGVPNDINGNKVVDMNHAHADGDDCYVELPFGQLYGGGQGVYGGGQKDKTSTHTGVEIYYPVYTITYVNNDEVIGEKCIYSDEVANAKTANPAAEAKAMEGITADNITFKGWMNAGSTIVETIDPDNTEDIILYPAYNNWYTAMFVDQQGELLDWMMFTTDQKSAVQAKATATEELVPETDELKFDYWAVQVHNTDGSFTTKKFSDYISGSTLSANDVTIYPVYLYEGDVNLIPIDSDGDGATNYYQVGGYSDPNGQNLVEIPASVNGIPVTSINAGAFAEYDGIHAVRIPASVTEIGDAILSDSAWSRQTVTIYYEGTYDQWNASFMQDGCDTVWSGLGTGSRVFLLDENGNVITNGYWELCSFNYVDIGFTSGWVDSKYDFVWEYHTHEYGNNGNCELHHCEQTDYLAECGCDDCKNAGLTERPDVEYWKREEATTAE